MRTEALVTAIEPGSVVRGGVDHPHRHGGVGRGQRGESAAPDDRRAGRRRGRVVGEPDCTVPGQPNVFVVGDGAAFTHDPALRAPSRDGAGGDAAGPVRRARHRRTTWPGGLGGRSTYVDKGQLAVIGRGDAVADIGPFRLAGFPAWFVWIFIHIAYLIGFGNRLIVLIRWGISYVTFERGARLITKAWRPRADGGLTDMTDGADATADLKAVAAEPGFLACGITSPRPGASRRCPRCLAGEGVRGDDAVPASPGEEAERAGTDCRRREVRDRGPGELLPSGLRSKVRSDRPSDSAKYAQGEDYHRAFLARLDTFGAVLRARGATVAHAYADSGPVPERELAQRAGLGWIGKNTMLIRPGAGSFFFIGTIFTDLDARGRPAVRARSLRELHPLPRCLSHRGVRRGAGARRHPLPLLPHHRVEGRRFPRSWPRARRAGPSAATSATTSVPGMSGSRRRPLGRSTPRTKHRTDPTRTISSG